MSGLADRPRSGGVRRNMAFALAAQAATASFTAAMTLFLARALGPSLPPLRTAPRRE